MLKLSKPDYMKLPWTHTGEREWQPIDGLNIPYHVGQGLFIGWMLHEEDNPPWHTCFDVGHGDIPTELRDCLQSEELRQHKVHVDYAEIYEP